MNVTAFVPFRKGSKGIPNKNIRPLGGIPLYLRTIQTLCAVPELESIVIATDYSEEDILPDVPDDPRIQFWDRAGLDSVKDEASTESALDEYFETADDVSVLLVQVTNPFLQPNHVSEALGVYKGIGTLFSVVPFDRYVWERAALLGQNDLTRKRRQDMEERYLENGAFYLFNLCEYFESRNRINHPIAHYAMPAVSLWEIDSEEDWIITEKLLSL